MTRSRRWFKRGRLLPLFMVVTLLVSFIVPVPAMAATSQDVTVTAAPAFVGIANDIATWTLNGILGSGKIAPDTVYYSNPTGDTTVPSSTVIDGECRFTITDSSTVNIDLVVDCGDFSGGDDNMTNSETGANGATDYGGYSWYSGITYASKVIMKTTASDDLKSAHTGNIKWGAEIETQSNAWTGGNSSTATMTISASAS